MTTTESNSLIQDRHSNQELDDLLLQYMALVDNHLATWTRVTEKFREGRELISQAKYIMGPKNVSADCYDHRMKALKGVSMADPLSIGIKDLAAERQRLAKEEQEREEATVDRALSSVERNESVEAEQSRSGLRRRGGGGGANVTESGVIHDHTQENSRDASTTSASTVPKKKERNPDPLLWFGVFVPGSLRNAQGVFKQSLHDVVEMAAIRQQLYELEKKIMLLRQDSDSIPDVSCLSLKGGVDLTQE